MKREDLIFKCVMPDLKTLNQISAGVGFSDHEKHYYFYRFNGQMRQSEGTCSPKKFLDWPEPTMAVGFIRCLIDNLEQSISREPAPIFDIQPFDRVIVRGDFNQIWEAAFYSYAEENGLFRVIGSHVAQMLPYRENNMALLGRADNPAGWWQSVAGEPAWVAL